MVQQVQQRQFLVPKRQLPRLERCQIRRAQDDVAALLVGVNVPMTDLGQGLGCIRPAIGGSERCQVRVVRRDPRRNADNSKTGKPLV